jgi:hypothetical protein
MLADAATRGTTALMAAWQALTPPQQKLLKAALDRFHKPTATAVDKAASTPPGSPG